VALSGAALVAPACTVGGGTGTASGELMVNGCNSDDTLKEPQPYNLRPTFFAGEPIEDICPLPGPCHAPHINRLVIRMQRIANRPVEVNDTLYFDIQNAREVARCVQGHIKDDGSPDWDTRLVTGPDGTTIQGLSWCVPAGGSVGVDGGANTVARINLSTQDYVRASLVPLFTCGEARVVGVSLPGAGSWIDFEYFGSAAEPQLPPEKRTGVDNDFKVEFGQRLRAHFHMVLGDQHVTYAMQTHMAVPEDDIRGILDGWFDFDLERGRAAQPFP
jgi:hypothetical protein